ncbi:DNA primase [Limibacter armeniacum]|uniref:DNA primase n=1 Tax=Limibacter armeniacum TaxID=466084 RepID=UPI002FE5E1AB
MLIILLLVSNIIYMSISQETIQKIKDTADLVEIVEGVVSLKKKGQYWWGLCPFHDDKSPSFAVTPNKGIYKCFSCGAAGDTIKFVEETQGVGYIEALKWLGQKYGIKVEEKPLTNEEKAKQERKESMMIALNYAKDFFVETMQKNEEGNAVGLGYFRERGFNNQIISKFDLGYSLNEWNALEQNALKKGYQADILAAAGLIMQKNDRQYDRFRGRVMFPIHDLSGRVIAFGARTLKKDDKPKYLNSPETEVYHKSDVLYGIFQGKNPIRLKDNCFLVEGYTDVLAMHQAGIENVVASSGTALTEGQIKLIKRFTNNITVLYDGDEAGINASLRGTDLILEQGLDVRVVLFPEGHDPDSYCREVGSQRFGEYLEANAKDFILFKTESLLKGAENDPIKRANVTRDIVQSISKIPDPIKQSVFYKECSRLLGIEEEILVDEGRKLKSKEIERREKEITRGRRPWEQTPPPPEDIPTGYPEEEAPMEDYIIGDKEAPSKPKESPLGYSAEKKHVDSIQRQEMEFVRLLISHGNTDVEIDKLPTKLYHFMFDEIGDISFDAPVLHEIVINYKNQAALGNIPDVNYFLNSDNESVRLQVQELLKREGNVSKNWDERFQIYVPDKDENLPKMIRENILRLKLTKTEKLLSECFERLSKTEDDNERNDLTLLFMELNNQKSMLGKELGRVF